MVKPRKGKVVKLRPPPHQRIRAHGEAVIAFVTPERVDVEIQRDSWRFPAGTHLLLRRAALLGVDQQLVAPNAAVVRVYPPETQNPRSAAEAPGRALEVRNVSRGTENDSSA